MNNLVIVESPTKARTLEKYLGKGYQVVASMGHIRDLPKSELGVDVEKNFEPKYIIPRDKRKRVNDLKKQAQNAKVLWLASDPDREGEAIAWHIAELLRNSGVKSEELRVKNGKQEIKRVVFHEITPEAIKEAFQHPRDIDMQMVDAQQARRVLDRLVGYKLSPVLWAKVKRGLSAGRVQSVALRLIVERQREIEAFKAVEYWSIEAELEPSRKSQHTPPLEVESRFVAALIELNGKKLEIHNEKDAKTHLNNLEKADYKISKITEREVKRSPAPPFTTSTLQQTASNKLGMSAKKTMMLAQTLYEHGLITYMRTDSVNLSVSALTAARSYIKSELGESYLPSSPRIYKSKSKNAQEAHEAIRPTNVITQSSALSRQADFTRDHVRLYDLIWKRFLASQITDAIMDQTTVDVSAGSYIFRATGSVIKFEGWLKVYGQIKEPADGVARQSQPDETKEEGDAKEEEKILPKLEEGESLKLLELLPNQHFTEPPPKYTEASLIKKLEELGIGRPSTYAPILSTITERYYVEREQRKFSPTVLGFAVTDFLLKHFPDIFDYTFTAQMEDELDEISRGERSWQPTIKSFYDPLEKKIEETSQNAERVNLPVETVDKACPDCGKPLMVRIGKFGKFLACTGFPECKYTESLEEKIDAKCPEDGGEVVIRKTKAGKTFYGCKNWPNCKFASWNRPKSETPKNPEAPNSIDK